MAMPTPGECICCMEIEAVLNKIASFASETDNESVSIHCIREHEGFDAIWVLQTGFFSYRERYGTRDI